jgi:hypothetical protein
MRKASAGPAMLLVFGRPADYFRRLRPPVTPIARTWRRVCARNVTPPLQRAVHSKTRTPPLAMFRGLRALVQSILADTRTGPIRQRDDAKLVMTRCVLTACEVKPTVPSGASCSHHIQMQCRNGGRPDNPVHQCRCAARRSDAGRATEEFA